MKSIITKSSERDIPAKIIRMAKEEFPVPITKCMKKCIS